MNRPFDMIRQAHHELRDRIIEKVRDRFKWNKLFNDANLIAYRRAHKTQQDIRPRWGRLITTSHEQEYAIPMESV